MEENFLFLLLSYALTPTQKGEGVRQCTDGGLSVPTSTVERRNREGGAKPPLPAQL